MDGEPAGAPPAQQLLGVALLAGGRAELAVLHGEHPRSAAVRAALRLTPDPVTVSGRPVVESVLAEGPDGPAHLLRFGYPMVRAGSASPAVGAPAGVPGAAPGDQVLSPARGPTRGPRQPSPGPAAPPLPLRDLPQVQRAAAYAVVLQAGRLLLTRLTRSDVWTLPGGGIEPGETPVQAAVRELHEETGLALQPGELLDVDSIHFTGQAPDGRWEDYHGVRVVYAGQVPPGSRPRVVEVGGTTEEAAFLTGAELAARRLTGLARSVLTPQLVARLSR